MTGASRFGRLAAVAGSLILAVPLTACAIHTSQRGSGRVEARPNPFEVTPAEAAAAAELAEKAIVARELRGAGPFYLVATEVVRDKAAEEEGGGQRAILTTHYRYQGDLTIRTRVDLRRSEVVAVDALVGVPAPLAQEELDRARDLAFADPAVRRALGEQLGAVRVEPLVVRTADEEDPFYGRRLVRLLFKTATGYLRQPIVLVDLSGEKVIVEAPPATRPVDYPEPEG